MAVNDPAELLRDALRMHGAGRPEAARRLYLDCLDLRPRDPVATFALGVLCLENGRPDEAAAWLERAVRLDPANADASLALGRALVETARYKDALAVFERAIGLRPDDPDARNGQGAALLGLGLADQALQAHTLALAARPGDSDALAGQGNALLHLGRPQEAVQALQRALAASPGSPLIHNSLGAALKALGRLDEAKTAFEAAIEARPGFPEALGNLGSTLREMGCTEAAREAYQEALARHPGPGLSARLALLLPPIPWSNAAIEASRAELAEAIQRLADSVPRIEDPYAEVGETAFYLAYHGRDDLELQRAIAGLHLRACPDLAFTAPYCNRPPRPGRIRIGIVSAFLHNHTIGKLFGSLVEQLDRRRFEVVVLRLPGPDDARGRQLMSAADRAAWLPDSLPQARRMIAEAACDVLYYPDIGMHALSYFLSFARLARVQCVSWGHPVTTGVPNVDYYLSNRDLSPPHLPEGFSEQLVRLEGLGVCYPMPAPLGRAYTPADFGLPSGKRIYFCPQSLFKLHPDFDPALHAILRDDPKAVIALIHGKHPNWADTVRRRLGASGDLDPDRLVFLPRLSMEDFTGALTMAHALLDTFHFGGGNTTLEALAQDAPVVTLPGPFLRGRISLACYRRLDLDQPVASSPEDYAAKAVRLANDPAWRAELGRHISETKGQLFDDDQAVRELEDFWEKANRGEPLLCTS